MAEICVKIEVYDDGRVTVGVVPQEIEQRPINGQDEEQAEEAYMKPAKSIDDALMQAKQMLSQGPQGDSENAPMPSTPQPGAQQAWDEEAMQRMKAKQIING